MYTIWGRPAINIQKHLASLFKYIHYFSSRLVLKKTVSYKQLYLI